MIHSLSLDRARKRFERMLQSSVATDIRIEWKTTSGGTTDVVYDIVDSGTDTRNVLDTKGVLEWVDRVNTDRVENAIAHHRDAIWMINTDVNLKNRENFIIAQKIKDEYEDGSGAGSGSAWTVSASWTTDQWKGFWLVFSDKRFLITSNTATVLTVDLDGDTLPASDDYEIMAIKEWYPIDNVPGLEDNMSANIGNFNLLQGIYCTQIPMQGSA